MSTASATSFGEKLPTPTVLEEQLAPLSGRRRREKGYDRIETRATARLYEEFGEPWKLDTVGCSVLVWDVDPFGDSVVMARLSKDDLKGGETAMGQVEDGIRILRHNGRRIRRIIVATRLSGALLYEKRPDLALLEEMIGNGECGAVFFRDADRMARHGLILAILQELLEGTETDLYLAEPEGKLDWNEFSDRIMLALNGTISVVEREKIRKRTHGAIIRQYLKEGRGVGSKRPLGFFRNDNGYLEIDPDEWRWIERIHFGYYEMKVDGVGLDGFAKQLKHEGLDYSPEQLRKILTDEIYVTGLFTTTWKGEIYDGYVEGFSGGIPRKVFARNQVVLAATATRPLRRTPLGLFALNGLLVCAKCGGPLEGRIQNQAGRSKRVYRHRSTGGGVPAQCKGDVYERAVIDKVVLKELLRLDKCEELRRSYWRNAWPEDAARGLTDSMRERENELKAELTALQSTQRARIEERQERLVSVSDDEVEAELVRVDPEELELAYKIRCARKALANLPGMTRHRTRKRLDLTVSSAELRTAFEETIDSALQGTVVEDLEAGARLTQMLKACLDRVVVHKTESADGTTSVEIELFGPRVPEGVPPLQVIPPHRTAGYALGFASERAQEAFGTAQAAVQTVQHDYSCLTVCTAVAWQSPRIVIGSDK
jgi:DNA invertase Pin-like site-specific DNA recombinase